MKVYIVTSGCYSDYRIEAVFTNEETAKQYANLDNSIGGLKWNMENIGQNHIVTNSISP